MNAITTTPLIETHLDIKEIHAEIELCKRLPVLVEGPNDKRALEKLGFTSVTHLNKALYAMVEQLQDEEELLLLTDLDDHGRKLYKYFYHEFTKRGVLVNNRLRLLLTQTPVRQIEGLAHYLDSVEDGMNRE